MKPFSIREFLKLYEPKNGNFYTIAIDGRGGSGKTLFAEFLKTLLPDYVFINGDDYFEPVENQTVWGDFNEERFRADVLIPLKKSKEFTYRPYDWHSEPHISETRITVSEGICIERCFSFDFDFEWDLKIWVETSKDLCLERGLAREKMPKERVLTAWKEAWQPREDEYIAKYKPLTVADIVIDGTRPFLAQISA